MAAKDHKSQPTELRVTPVVTCFLLRQDEPEPRICLVRRSQRVGSYQGRWGGISGFLEEGVTPLEQAYTEIHEETHLSREQVRFLKRGEVVEYVDEELRRHWLVHPFLVEVLAPEAIQLDWEAVEMSWVTSWELSACEGVPRLQDAFLSAVKGETLISR